MHWTHAISPSNLLPRLFVDPSLAQVYAGWASFSVSTPVYTPIATVALVVRGSLLFQAFRVEVAERGPWNLLQ